MKARKFLHIMAVMLSSIASLVSHGTAKAEGTPAKKVKKSGNEISKLSRTNGATASSSDASEDPPKKLNPSLMASADLATPKSMPSALTSIAPRPGDENSRYAWKNQIVTTVFWIGE